MKNIFKFAFIALFSATLFAACGDKDSDEPSYSVTIFDTEYTTFGYIHAKVVTLGGEQCLLLEGHPSNITGITATSDKNLACPGFRVVLNGTGTGTYESSSISGQYTLIGTVRNYEFFNNGWIVGRDNTTGAEEAYGDWWGLKDVKVEITKFDSEKKLASFTASGDMFNANTAILQRRGIDASAKSKMTIRVDNMPIE